MRIFKALFYLFLLAFAFDLTVHMNGGAEGHGFFGAHWWNYFDLASVVFIFAGCLFSLVVFRFSDVVFALQDGLGFSEHENLQERGAKSLIVLRGIGGFVLLSGASCTMIGIIQAMGNIEAKYIGPAMALSLLALFYALIVRYFLIFPLELSVRRRLLAHQEEWV